MAHVVLKVEGLAGRLHAMARAAGVQGQEHCLDGETNRREGRGKQGKGPPSGAGQSFQKSFVEEYLP